MQLLIKNTGLEGQIVLRCVRVPPKTFVQQVRVVVTSHVVEILQSGLENDLAQLSDIKLNGISFGDCNPSGSEIACSFYNCFDDQSIKEVTSYTGLISVELIYRKVPQHICDCNLKPWACSPKSGYSGHIPHRAPTRAAAKINLTPIRNMKGGILIFHPNLHF